MELYGDWLKEGFAKAGGVERGIGGLGLAGEEFGHQLLAFLGNLLERAGIGFHVRRRKAAR